MTWLLEAECPPDKSPKIPDTTPKPEKQAGPTILGRVAATIVNGRQRLSKATGALGKLKKKAATAKTDAKKEKAEIAVACQDLKIKAAAARLEKSLNRWKNLEKLATTNLGEFEQQQAHKAAAGEDTSKLDELIKKIKAYLSLGGQEAGNGAKHLGGYADEDFEEPPITNFSYSYKKTPDGNYLGFVGADGKTPFDVEAEVEKAGIGEKTIAPKEPEPPPPPPTPKVDLTKTDPPKPPEKDPFFKDNVALSVASVVAEDPYSASLSKIVAHLDAAAEAEGIDVTGNKSLNAYNALRLSLPIALYDDLSSADKTTAKDIAKGAAVKHALAGHHEHVIGARTRAAIAAVFASKDIQLAASSIMSLAAAAMAEHTDKDYQDLAPAQQDALLVLAKDAYPKGGSAAVHDAVKKFGVVALSPAGMAALVELAEPKATPDMKGFLSEIREILGGLAADYPIPTSFGGIVTAIDEKSDTKFIGLMSKHHIEKVKGTGTESLVRDQAEWVIGYRWNGAALQQLLFAEWDEKAPIWPTAIKEVFVSMAIGNIIGSLPAIAVGGYKDAIELMTDEGDVHLYVGAQYDEWLKGYQKKKAADADKKDAKLAAFVDGLSSSLVVNIAGEVIVTPVMQAAIKKFADEHYGGDTNPVIDAIEDAAGALGTYPTAPEPTKPVGPPLPAIVIPPKTKFTKISKPAHLTAEQKTVLKTLIGQTIAAGTCYTAKGQLKKQLGGVATKIGDQFKQVYGDAGLKLMIGKSLLTGMLKAAAESALTAPADPSVPKGAITGSHPDWTLYGEAKQLSPEAIASLNPAAKSAFDDMMQKVFTDLAYEESAKYDGSPFASYSQQSYFKKLLAMAQAFSAAPAPAPAPVAPPPETKAAALGSTVAPQGHLAVLGFGSEASLAQFMSLDAHPTAKTPPPFASTEWKGNESAGNKAGSRPKLFLGSTETGSTAHKTLAAGASHAWMFKHEGAVSLGEIAANRTQALLGLGNMDVDCFAVEKDGTVGVMQHFEALPHFRELGRKRPWAQCGKNNDAVTAQLMQYHVANWLLADKDDHGGNFVIDEETGQLTAVDHGQATKFFDSSNTMLKDLNWEPPPGAHQDGGKGLPKRMLKEYMAGKITLPPLSTIAEVVARAEAIPSDAYQAMWAPYAKGLAKRDKLARYSTTSVDKTPEGYLSGMDERRATVRKQVGALYAHLIKTRAQAMAAQGLGDAAALEAAEREAMGLDTFLAGEGVGTTTADKKVVEAAAGPAPAGWDESKLPESSHLPDEKVIAERGYKGIDMEMGGDDIKDGRAKFYQLGDVPFTRMYLNNEARERLAALLPGAGAGPPPPSKPTEPYYQPFEEPPKPTFAATTESLAKKLHGAGGYTSNAKHPDGSQISKLEKYVHKWSKGTLAGKEAQAAEYVKKSITAAEQMAVSADPLEAAAGKHFLAEIKKLGEATGPHGWTFKDTSQVPADQQKIAPFEPTGELKTAQDEAKKDIEAAHKKAVAAAKIAHDEKIKGLKDGHAAALKTYAGALADYEQKLKDKGTLPAVKLSHMKTPQGVEFASGKIGADVHEGEMDDFSSTWGGEWQESWDTHKNPTTTYEMDFTGKFPELADVETGGATGKLVIDYIPTQHGDRKRYAMRKGQLRIQWPAGTTKEQMRSVMAKLGPVLGTEMRPADEKDQELTYLRRMAWIRKVRGYGTHSGSDGGEPEHGTVQEKIDHWIERFKEAPNHHKNNGGGFGRDPRFMADGVTPNPAYQPIARDIGRSSRRRFDVSDEHVKKMRAEKKKLWRKSKDRAGYRNGMVQISTEQRAAIGLMEHQHGTLVVSKKKNPSMSSALGDVGTGGSGETFLFGTTSAAPGRYTVDVAILAETACYQQAGDEWGAKTDGRQLSRAVTPMDWWSTKSGSGELTMGDVIDLKHFVRSYKLGPSPGGVAAHIAKLHAAGITHLGPLGKKVEAIFSE